MGWLVLFALVAFVVAAMNSAKARKNEAQNLARAKNEADGVQTINALADIMSSESVFRDSLQYLSRRLTNSEIPSNRLDEVVQKFYGRHLELCNTFRTVTHANQEILMPVLSKREDALTDEIAVHLGSPLSEALRGANKAGLEKIQQDFLQEKLGLKL